MKLKQKINQWRGNYSLLSKGQKMFLKASVTLNLLAINYIVWVIIFIPAVQAKMIEVLEIDKIQTEIIVNQSEELSMEEWVLTEVRKAGLNSNKVWAIIQAESAWREDICIIEPNNTISCGLWQLNTIHNMKLHKISNRLKKL